MPNTETAYKRKASSLERVLLIGGAIACTAMLGVVIAGRMGVRSSLGRVAREDAATPIDWSASATVYRGRIGQSFTFRCPGGTARRVWGTDLYTDDSSICTAALHAGRIRADSGGTVQIIVHPGLTSYDGSLRNGVTSASFTRAAGTFSIAGGPAPGLITVRTPDSTTPPRWAENATRWRGRSGEAIEVQCPAGGTFGPVWGTDLYTDDSSVCTAALHAGRITHAHGGAVTLYIRDGQPSYQGSERNGVTSAAYREYPGSFTFDRDRLGVHIDAPPGSTAIAWSANGTVFRGENGRTRRLYCPPRGALGTVWGSGPYTDDSSLCSAAVHAGLITIADGGAFSVRTAPGLARYAGSTRNGVSTQDYGVFAGSVTLSR